MNCIRAQLSSCDRWWQVTCYSIPFYAYQIQWLLNTHTHCGWMCKHFVSWLSKFRIEWMLQLLWCWLYLIAGTYCKWVDATLFDIILRASTIAIVVLSEQGITNDDIMYICVRFFDLFPLSAVQILNYSSANEIATWLLPHWIDEFEYREEENHRKNCNSKNEPQCSSQCFVFLVPMVFLTQHETSCRWRWYPLLLY